MDFQLQIVSLLVIHIYEFFEHTIKKTASKETVFLG